MCNIARRLFLLTGGSSGGARAQHVPEPTAPTGRTEPGDPAAYCMPRAHYAAMFGPTAGDKVLLSLSV
eukprot:2620-Pyramimonas_sp.AAC.2